MSAILGLIRFLKKLILGTLFLFIFGLAVFTGTLLWKDGQLTWGNFFSHFVDHSISLFNRVKSEIETRNKPGESVPESSEKEPEGESLEVEALE